MSATGARPAPGPRPGAGPLGAWGLALWLVVLTPTAVLAHGVELSHGQGPTAWVRAEYSGGEPMSYAKVRVFDPQGRAHQVGNADAQGGFAWLAGQPGPWRVVVEDGMGHHGELAVEIGRTAPPPAQAPGEGGRDAPPWVRLWLGLAAIMTIGGVLSWWRAARLARGRRPCGG